MNLLEKEIDRSRYILHLENGWDGERGIPIPALTYTLAISLLRAIYNVVTPDINPCRDGSIDLSWRHKHIVLLVNIKEDRWNVYGEGDVGYIKLNGKFDMDTLNPMGIEMLQSFTRKFL